MTDSPLEPALSALLLIQCVPHVYHIFGSPPAAESPRTTLRQWVVPAGALSGPARGGRDLPPPPFYAACCPTSLEVAGRTWIVRPPLSQPSAECPSSPSLSAAPSPLGVEVLGGLHNKYTTPSPSSAPAARAASMRLSVRGA